MAATRFNAVANHIDQLRRSASIKARRFVSRTMCLGVHIVDFALVTALFQTTRVTLWSFISLRRVSLGG